MGNRFSLDLLSKKHPYKGYANLRDALAKRKVTETAFLLGSDENGGIIDIDFDNLLICGKKGAGRSTLINSILIAQAYNRSSNELDIVLVQPHNKNFSALYNLPHVLNNHISTLGTDFIALEWVLNDINSRQNQPSTKRRILVIDECYTLIKKDAQLFEKLCGEILQKAAGANYRVIIATAAPEKLPDSIIDLLQNRVVMRLETVEMSNKLLGQKGAEGLQLAGEILLRRINDSALYLRGFNITNNEIANIVENYHEEVRGLDSDIEADASYTQERRLDEDEAEELIDMLVAKTDISTSDIQKKLRWGYNRAVDLILWLENLGVVSEPKKQDGRIVRAVLISDVDELRAKVLA